MSRLAPFALTALVTVLVHSPALAAAPGGGGGGGGGAGVPPGSARRDPGALPLQGESAGLQVGGKVVDRAGQPIAGIVIKMFANGMIIASETTDPEGGFEIEGNPQLGGNNTTMLWFEDRGGELVPTGVILALGSVAEDRDLYPDCTKKIDFLGNAARIEVTMLTLDQRNADVQQSDCLGASSAP
jgi:hypothetical protein